jgi:hypothetical protein
LSTRVAALLVAGVAVAAGAGGRAQAGPADELRRDEAALARALDRAARAAAPAATVDGPVPATLRPRLAKAHRQRPRVIADGCHVKLGRAQTEACRYGHPKNPVRVVLFGDSHAVSWWPAMERLLGERRWQLLSLTMSGCGAADVASWYSAKRRPYPECIAWRARAIEQIERERPALIVLAENSGVALLGPDGKRARGDRALTLWREGLIRTARRLRRIPGARVVILADTPRALIDVPACLAAHPASHLACATPYAVAVSEPWRDAAAEAARAAGVAFVDPTAWICPTRPCPAVIGNFLVLRDDHHLAVPFAAALAGRLGAALPRPGSR